MCIVEGCDNDKIRARGYCSRHYDQMRNHGKILDRTCYDKNEITIENDVAYINLYDHFGNVRSRAIIDIDDIEKISTQKWHTKDNRGISEYCISNSVGLLHRFLLDLSSENTTVVDHINGNPLDNRRNNLRTCTSQENSRNCRIPKNNKSGHKGIYWVASRNK